MTKTPTCGSLLGVLGAIPLATTGVLATTSTAAEAATTPVPTGLRPGDRLDQLITRLHDEGRFSGTVRVTRKGRPVFERSIGHADRDTGVDNTRGTRFSLGSVTKMFTAVALLQLVQEHRVDLTAPIGTYLDGFAPEIADTVTPHHMLLHSSGLRDFMQIPGYFEEAATWTTVADTWEGGLSFVRRDTLAFTPGLRQTYSNTGYYILGAIVAAVSGRTYYDYVAENVFARAGMRRSGFFTTDDWAADPTIARPYEKGEDVLDDRQIYVGSPAGGSFADVADLERFMNAFYGEKLLDAPFTLVATTPKNSGPALPQDPSKPDQHLFNSYATGMRLVRHRDWVTGHNGGAPGISANVDRYPRGEWISATLSNAGDRTTAPVDSLITELITSS